MDIENPEPLSLPKTVNIHAAKTHLSKLVDEAHAGAEIILAKMACPTHGWYRLTRPPRRHACWDS